MVVLHVAAVSIVGDIVQAHNETIVDIAEADAAVTAAVAEPQLYQSAREKIAEPVQVLDSEPRYPICPECLTSQDNLIHHVLEVLAAWETGDLAAAVRALNDDLVCEYCGLEFWTQIR